MDAAILAQGVHISVEPDSPDDVGEYRTICWFVMFITFSCYKQSVLLIYYCIKKLVTYLLMHNFCPISVFGTISIFCPISTQFPFSAQSYKLALCSFLLCFISFILVSKTVIKHWTN